MSLEQALLHNLTGRLDDLGRTIAGFERSGVPLVAFDSRGYTAAGTADDIGLYLFVPKIMRLFHLSLPAAVMLFLGGLIAVSFAAGAAALYRLDGRRVTARSALTLGALLVATIAAWNVYSVLSCAVVALVPWILVVLRGPADGRGAPVFFLGAGAAAAVANSIRVHAGTAVLVFALALLASDLSREARLRARLAAALLAGFLVMGAAFSTVIARRDAFLAAHQPDAVPTRGHVFWHAVYFGFSFLNSPYNLPTTDGGVQAVVHAAAPGTKDFSPEYERTARRLAVRFAATHPYFVLRTLCAKAGILALYFVIFANVGLTGGAPLPVPWRVAFGVAIAFSALPGLLVTPYHFYMLGFMAFAALYGLARRVPA